MKNYNIAIFVPHKGCPNDCVFCNQKRITASLRETTPEDVKKIIEKNLETLPKIDRRVEAAFFGGSFTGIPMDEQNALLSAAYAYVKSGLIDGIRLSTRPDYIDRAILDNLLRYGVTTIELGVQSMDEDVLLKSNRGHTREDVIRAAELIREYPFALGLQMMTGLPGDTDKKSMRTAEEIIALRPDIVRIYPTLTIKDTRLEEMYKSGEYIPQTVESAARLCARLLQKFEENNITVIRLGLQSTEEISEGGDSVVAGPLHSAFREIVESEIYYGIITDKLRGVNVKKADIFVAPAEISKAAGHKRMNIKRIKENYGTEIKIHEDENLHKREVRYFCC